MPKNWRLAKWKSDSDDRPRNGGAPRTAESLTVGLRVIYVGEKARHLPIAGNSSLKLNHEQYCFVTKDLNRLEGTFGAVAPRKADVQLCPCVTGTVDMVWPELDRSSQRYKRVLSGLKSLQRTSARDLSYLAISCIITYFLPPALTSMDRQQPWDAPCAIVSDPRTVDEGLEALCRAALVKESLLEEDGHEVESTRPGRQRLPSSTLSAGSSSARATTPGRTRSPHRKHPRSPSPARPRPRSPARSGQDRPARRDRRWKASFSPPPTHFAPGKVPPAHSGPPDKDSPERSPTRASSPPRKRIRAQSPQAASAPTRLGAEARELEERVQRLERENDEACQRERALRVELDVARRQSRAGSAVQEEVDDWKIKAEQAEERMHLQWQRLRACVGSDPDVAVDSDDEERALDALEQILARLQRRVCVANEAVDATRAHIPHSRRKSLDSRIPAQGIIDAWCMVSDLAQDVFA
ncbi:hypothetical protein PENSPDRAFT_750775 [Peniophora sp. CONT]|nr:hypothetical protein PENSPDRAFT_750775 [Peniophora sp. CONT]